MYFPNPDFIFKKHLPSYMFSTVTKSFPYQEMESFLLPLNLDRLMTALTHRVMAKSNALWILCEGHKKTSASPYFSGNIHSEGRQLPCRKSHYPKLAMARKATSRHSSHQSQLNPARQSLPAMASDLWEKPS